ncbi:MAG: hypothetical protein CME05_15685, partial [Gemmatimonadaceae bacterium]|nr:hypothetical protein [Gemmatimonadaceae bacterium]
PGRSIDVPWFGDVDGDPIQLSHDSLFIMAARRMSRYLPHPIKTPTTRDDDDGRRVPLRPERLSSGDQPMPAVEQWQVDARRL